MKKKAFYKGIALSLAAAVLLSSQPINIAAETTNDAVTETVATQLYNDGTYYYATVNMPYADFYYGELNDITPATAVSLTTNDPVASYRAAGQYDAVSSATTTKSTKFGATYYETTESGVDILGLKDVQVAIPVALYDSIVANESNESSCQNELYDFFNNMTFSDVAFDEYKIMSGDGTFTAMTTASSASYEAATTVADATATITTKSSWGNYQISISGINVDSSSMLGVLLETSDGSIYGMEHEENLWLKTAEMSFAVEDFTEVHGNKVDYLRHATLPGKTITKITYLVKNASDVVINTNLLVKYLLTDAEENEITVTDVNSNAAGMTATCVNGLAASKSYDATLSSITYGGTALDSSLYSYNSSDNTITLDNSLKPGSYTAVFTDNAYEDVEATFNVLSALKAEDISVTNNQLVINSTDATVSEYINAITAVKVNGTSISGSNLGSALFNEDGTINFDAAASFYGSSQTFFADGVNADYTLSIEANGYPSIEASVGKSYQLYPLTSVSLNKSTLALTVGKTSKLTATYAPVDTTDATDVTYTSSKTSVATVAADGTVTAVNAGTAVITAQIGTLTATCKVTVSHAYGSETVIKAATTTKAGQMGKVSTTGGDTIITSTIPKIKSVTLGTTSYAYTGKAKTPSVTVKGADGKTISSKYYTVTYPSSRKAIGSYTVKITFNGKYSGTVSRTFTITPAKATVTLKSATKTSLKVSYKKVTGATKYVIEYSTSASFKNAKTVTVSGTSKTLTNLKKNTKYYVRVRSYKTVTVSGKKTNVYSSWSTAKNLTTKKK